MNSLEQAKNEGFNNIINNDISQISIDQWERDFDLLNNFDEIADNSDFDSDNEIDPQDTLQNLSKDDKILNKEDLIKRIKIKKPIKITLVGKQNVGKSSIVNSLIKENRVIISDVPGTTRDAIPIEWIYKGRRIILTDTAGMQSKNKVHEKVNDIKINLILNFF